jgi:hypothetical protein
MPLVALCIVGPAFRPHLKPHLFQGLILDRANFNRSLEVKRACREYSHNFFLFEARATNELSSRNLSLVQTRFMKI